MKLIVSVVFWVDAYRRSHLEHRRSNSCTYCKRRGSSSCRQRRVAKIIKHPSLHSKTVVGVWFVLVSQICSKMIFLLPGTTSKGPSLEQFFGREKRKNPWGLKGRVETCHKAVAESKAASHAAAWMTLVTYCFFWRKKFHAFGDLLGDGCFWW